MEESELLEVSNI